MLVEQIAQQIKNIRLQSVHNIRTIVNRCVMLRHLHCLRTDINCGNARSAALGSIQRKGTGVGKAVQHMLALGNLGNRLTVIFLVEEEACLLAVFYINRIFDAVFDNLGSHSAEFGAQIGSKPVLALLHALQQANSYVIALIQAADFLSHLAQNFNQQLKQHLLAHFNTQGQGLRYQQIVVAVYGQAGKHIRFAENQTAAVKITLAHNRQAVIQRIAQAALPKGFVKLVIGIGGNNAHTDFGMVVHKAGAQILALGRYYIHQITVGILAFNFSYLFTKHPGMTAACSALSLRGYEKFCIFTHILPHDF